MMNNFIARSMVKEIRGKVDELKESLNDINVGVVYDLKFYAKLHEAVAEMSGLLDSLESELNTKGEGCNNGNATNKRFGILQGPEG